MKYILLVFVSKTTPPQASPIKRSFSFLFTAINLPLFLIPVLSCPLCSIRIHIYSDYIHFLHLDQWNYFLQQFGLCRILLEYHNHCYHEQKGVGKLNCMGNSAVINHQTWLPSYSKCVWLFWQEFSLEIKVHWYVQYKSCCLFVQ